MVSGQTKCYDYSFIAGEAAAQRLAAHLINYDVAAKTIRIGRPKLDTPPATNVFDIEGLNPKRYASPNVSPPPTASASESWFNAPK